MARIDGLGAELAEAVARNYQRWPNTPGETWQGKVQELRAFIVEHLAAARRALCHPGDTMKPRTKTILLTLLLLLGSALPPLRRLPALSRALRPRILGAAGDAHPERLAADLLFGAGLDGPRRRVPPRRDVHALRGLLADARALLLGHQRAVPARHRLAGLPALRHGQRPGDGGAVHRSDRLPDAAGGAAAGPLHDHLRPRAGRLPRGAGRAAPAPRGASRSPAVSFAFGLLCGFSFWTNMAIGPAVAVALLLLLWHLRGFFSPG